LVFGRVLDTDAVLSVVLPLTNILVAVREGHRPVAILFALFEVSLVLPSILVGELTLSFE